MEWKMKKMEMERTRKIFSVVVEIIVIVSLGVNIFIFGPIVLFESAKSSDISDAWNNSTTLNVIAQNLIPRILWYDNQTQTWVSRFNSQNDKNDRPEYRFIISNKSSDNGWNIQFINITNSYNQLIDSSTSNQTVRGTWSLFPQYFWDTTTNYQTLVHHSVGNILNTIDDMDRKAIILTVSVEKTNWTLIEVVDLYPDFFNFIVKTLDGRTISSEMIWREDGKIFILDDPVTDYQIIYSYSDKSLFDIKLDITPDSVHVGSDVSVTITLINVGEPGTVKGTMSYALYRGAEIIWSSEENVSVLSEKTYTKAISTDGLSPGSYVNKVVYNYADSQTTSVQEIFTIAAIQQPLSDNILLWTVIYIIVIIIIIIIDILLLLDY